MLARETASLRLGLGWRDELESPLVTTTTWNLLRREPAVVDNLPAMYGRARELQLGATVRLGPLPFWFEAEHARAFVFPYERYSHTLTAESPATRGDQLWYRRTRTAMAGEIPLGSMAAAVPQISYGWLDGDAAPQAAFYLGGSRSLRSLPSSSRAGTRHALARLEVIALADLLASERLGHGIMVQGGTFAAAGAVWGEDPFGGSGSPADGWPPRAAWQSEVGLSLLYRPGLPDPEGYLRLDYAFPLEDDDRSNRLAIYYARPLDLVNPTGR
jgi:hypothetical protein